MTPKTTETTRARGSWLRAVALTAAVGGLLLGTGAGTLAAPTRHGEGIVAFHADEEPRIVPRGSDAEAPETVEEELEFSEEDDIAGTDDGGDTGEGDTGRDDDDQEGEGASRQVRFAGISRPGAHLDPSQWVGASDGRLLEPFAVTPAPARLTIDEIGVDARITTREIVNGEMQTPADEHEVTWYKETGRPGEQGNMVFSGHLNWYGVPEAVFYRINELEKGDEIAVTGADGKTHTYRVRWVKLVDIEEADVAELVGQTRKASLTLITCGGQWEAALGQYGHRTVVRAELVSR